MHLAAAMPMSVMHPKVTLSSADKRRRAAEELARRRPVLGAESLEVMSSQETLRRLHELEVHQIELEMQNEELERARVVQERLEERHQLILRTTIDGFWVVDDEGRLLEVNQTYCEMSGYAEDELLTMHVRDLDVEESRDQVLAHVKSILLRGQDRFESLHRRKDGTVFNVEVSARCLATPTGQLVVFLRDITKRKLAEAALRHFEGIVRSSDDAIIGKDLNGRILSWNPGAERMYGYPASEAVGRSIAMLTPPGREDELPTILSKLRLSESIKHLQTTRVRKDAQVIQVSLTISPIHDATGLVVGASVIARDVTELKRNEAVMKARLRLLRFADSHSLGELLQATVDEAEALTGSTVGFYHCLERDQLGISLEVWSTRTTQEACNVDGAGPHYSVDQAGVWLDCVRTREPVIRNDYASLFRRKQLPDGHLPVSRELVVPVLRGDKVVGLLGVGNKPTDYGVMDVQALASLCDLAWDITQRKREEAALRESEERYRRMVETANEGVLAIDRENRATFVNARMAEMLGCEPTVIIGRKIEDFLFAQDLPEHEQRMLKRQAGQNGAYERRFRRPDGTAIWATVSATAIMDDQGAFAGSFAMIADISERKRAEEALRETAERLRGIVENSGAGYFLIDRQGSYRDVNATWLRLHKFDTKEEILGRHFAVTQLEEDQSHAKEIVDRVLAGESIPPGEFRRRCKDGSIGWHTFTLSAVWQGRSVIGLEGFLIDGTERKRAEENYQTLFRQMLDGFALHEILCDPQGDPSDYRFLAVNPAFERLTGLHAEKLIGRTVLEVIPGTERHWIETYGKVALTGESTYFENYSADLKKHFQVKAFRPAPKQFACIFADITEHKRLEAQLRQAQKLEAIGQLAGGVAHDFNNILAAIMMSLGVLQNSSTPESERSELLKDLATEVKRAANLTRQLLMFSRRSVLETKVVDVNEVVENLLKMLRRVIGEHLELRFEPSTTPMLVEADAGMLEQVLMNLSVNARDAMPQMGRLTITTRALEISARMVQQNSSARPGRFVCLSLSDTGCGIDEATLPQIFDPFFTTKEVGKGTGLGLATVHGIVGQHKGWIEVSSQVGKGSTFRVYLPAVACPVETTTPTPTCEAGALQAFRGKETILLVEDEASVRRNVAKLLDALGYRVLEAGNGADAMDRWARNRDEIALLLTDMVMPGGLSGLDLAERLRSEKPQLKVILSSGYSADLSAHGHRNLAGINYLPKPYEARALGEVLRSCLDLNSQGTP